MMKLTLVTACYNNAATLPDTLLSVQAQQALHLEYILIDGGSTDGTVVLIESEHAKQDSALANWVSEPDQGIYDALNKGIARATGEVLGFLHADDVFADTEVLARVASAFTDPAVQAVYGDLEYVSADNPTRVIRHWRSGSFRRERLRWGWMPPHPTLYLRRSLYERFGVFDTRYRIAADYDLMLRVLNQLEGKVVYLPQVLVRMRLGGASNRSLRQVMRKSWEDYQALRTNQVGGIGALAWKNLSKLPQFVQRRSER